MSKQTDRPVTTLHLTHAPVRSSIGVPRAFRSPLTWTDDRRATLGVAMRVMTLRAMVRHQSALVSSCFERCVTNFDTIKMSDAEESCMRKCIILRARYEARVGVLGQPFLESEQRHHGLDSESPETSHAEAPVH